MRGIIDYQQRLIIHQPKKNKQRGICSFVIAFVNGTEVLLLLIVPFA